MGSVEFFGGFQVGFLLGSTFPERGFDGFDQSLRSLNGQPTHLTGTHPFCNLSQEARRFKPGKFRFVKGKSDFKEFEGNFGNLPSQMDV